MSSPENKAGAPAPAEKDFSQHLADFFARMTREAIDFAPLVAAGLLEGEQPGAVRALVNEVIEPAEAMARNVRLAIRGMLGAILAPFVIITWVVAMAANHLMMRAIAWSFPSSMIEPTEQVWRALNWGITGWALAALLPLVGIGGIGIADYLMPLRADTRAAGEPAARRKLRLALQRANGAMLWPSMAFVLMAILVMAMAWTTTFVVTMMGQTPYVVDTWVVTGQILVWMIIQMTIWYFAREAGRGMVKGAEPFALLASAAGEALGKAFPLITGDQGKAAVEEAFRAIIGSIRWIVNKAIPVAFSRFIAPLAMSQLLLLLVRTPVYLVALTTVGTGASFVEAIYIGADGNVDAAKAARKTVVGFGIFAGLMAIVRIMEWHSHSMIIDVTFAHLGWVTWSVVLVGGALALAWWHDKHHAHGLGFKLLAAALALLLLGGALTGWLRAGGYEGIKGWMTGDHPASYPGAVPQTVTQNVTVMPGAVYVPSGTYVIAGAPEGEPPVVPQDVRVLGTVPRKRDR